MTCLISKTHILCNLEVTINWISKRMRKWSIKEKANERLIKELGKWAKWVNSNCKWANTQMSNWVRKWREGKWANEQVSKWENEIWQLKFLYEWTGVHGENTWLSLDPTLIFCKSLALTGSLKAQYKLTWFGSSSSTSMMVLSTTSSLFTW